MRLLVATHFRASLGGIERYLSVLLPALLERDIEVGLLFEEECPPSATAIDQQLNIPVWHIPYPSAELPPGLLAWNPELVYSQGLRSWRLTETLLRSYPLVLFAHVYHGTCGTGAKVNHFPTIQPCSRTFSTLCYARHYLYRCGGLNPLTTHRLFQEQLQHLRLLPLHRKILVASTHMQQEYLRHCRSPAAEVLHLPVLPAVSPHPDSPVPLAPPYKLLFVGRLQKVKGLDYLVRAMPQVTRALGQPLELHVIGDGPERAPLHALAASLGVSIRFHGWLPPDDCRQAYAGYHLLVVPSLWPEPFGFVGPEAGALGVPAVGFATGGITEWLQPGVSGELAPADPPTRDGLAAAICRALATPEHYASLCAQARRMSASFTLCRHLDHLSSLLREVHCVSTAR